MSGHSLSLLTPSRRGGPPYLTYTRVHICLVCIISPMNHQVCDVTPGSLNSRERVVRAKRSCIRSYWESDQEGWGPKTLHESRVRSRVAAWNPLGRRTPRAGRVRHLRGSVPCEGTPPPFVYRHSRVHLRPTGLGSTTSGRPLRHDPYLP